MRLIDADKLIDDYNKSEGTISDLMELILDAAEEALPPNNPLTPEELREMEKEPEPIYIPGLGWKICFGIEDFFGRSALKVGATARIYLDNYGECFVAYRRKPEEQERLF